MGSINAILLKGVMPDKSSSGIAATSSSGANGSGATGTGFQQNFYLMVQQAIKNNSQTDASDSALAQLGLQSESDTPDPGVSTELPQSGIEPQNTITSPNSLLGSTLSSTGANMGGIKKLISNLLNTTSSASPQSIQNLLSQIQTSLQSLSTSLPTCDQQAIQQAIQSVATLQENLSATNTSNVNSNSNTNLIDFSGNASTSCDQLSTPLNTDSSTAASMSPASSSPIALSFGFEPAMDPLNDTSKISDATSTETPSTTSTGSSKTASLLSSQQPPIAQLPWLSQAFSLQNVTPQGGNQQASLLPQANQVVAMQLDGIIQKLPPEAQSALKNALVQTFSKLSSPNNSQEGASVNLPQTQTSSFQQFLTNTGINAQLPLSSDSTDTGKPIISKNLSQVQFELSNQNSQTTTTPSNSAITRGVTLGDDDSQVVTPQTNSSGATSSANSNNSAALNASVQFTLSALDSNQSVNAIQSNTSPNATDTAATNAQAAPSDPHIQVLDAALATLPSGKTEISVQLHPDSLGDVRMVLTTNSLNELTAKIITQTPEAKSELEKNLGQLVSSLQENGVSIGKISVVQAGASQSFDAKSDQQFGSFQGGHQQQSTSQFSNSGFQQQQQQQQAESFSNLFNANSQSFKDGGSSFQNGETSSQQAFDTDVEGEEVSNSNLVSSQTSGSVDIRI